MELAIWRAFSDMVTYAYTHTHIHAHSCIHTVCPTEYAVESWRDDISPGVCGWLCPVFRLVLLLWDNSKSEISLFDDSWISGYAPLLLFQISCILCYADLNTSVRIAFTNGSTYTLLFIPLIITHFSAYPQLWPHAHCTQHTVVSIVTYF